MPPTPATANQHLVHKGYSAQLRVETVPEWTHGYIQYDELLKAVAAIRENVGSGTSAAVNNATTVFNDVCVAEIVRSAVFFANEITIVAMRLKEVTGAAPEVALNAASRHSDVPPEVTPQQRFKSPAVWRAKTPSMNERAQIPGQPRTATASSLKSRSTEDVDDSSSDDDRSTNRASSARRSSRMSRVLDPFAKVELEARRVVIVPLREMTSVVEKLFRFADVQAKSLRHILDEVRSVCPGAFDDSEIQHTWEECALVTELPTLTQLENAIKAETVIAGGNVVDPTATGAATSTAEAYDWCIKWHFVALAVVVLIVLAAIPIFEDNRNAHNCAAIIGCLTVLWVTEAMPYFASAMLIPLLAVPMNVLPGMDHKGAGKALLGQMFNDTQVLVLGGLCMGKAISKHHLEQYVARLLLRRVAHRPALYLLVVMVMSALLCAIISNVAAPVLVMSVVQPSLWELPEESGAAQGILLAVAFACNFGGMLTPIASPQNAVAQDRLGNDPISFGSWIAAALPIVVCGIFVSWLAVLLIWKPFAEIDYIPMPLAKSHTKTVLEQKPGPPAKTPHQKTAEKRATRDMFPSAPVDDAAESEMPLLYATQVVADIQAERQKFARVEIGMILVVIFVTVALWCVPQDHVLGDTGVVALIPIVVFFGVGVLTKADFNSLSWHLIFLLSGGNMLGEMAHQSNLLHIVIEGLRPFLEQHSKFQVVAVLIASVALVTTFVSHTVAALLLMPVIVRISAVNPDLPSAQALVFLCVIMCSGSMAFPITSFPNVNSLLTEARDGRQYLLARHFLLPGALISLTVMVELMTYMVPVADGLMPRNGNESVMVGNGTFSMGAAATAPLAAGRPWH